MNPRSLRSLAASLAVAVLPGSFQSPALAADDPFLHVYKVLSHPRCRNCHPVGDRPLQGDDGHAHAFRVRRGVDGGGISSERCANCHQAQNQVGDHAPPGTADPKAEAEPRWHLPAAAHPMPFEQRTPGQLCKQILNTSANGGMSRQQLIQHVTEDPLVRWGWTPGEGRTTPPGTHASFVESFRAWIASGAGCPK